MRPSLVEDFGLVNFLTLSIEDKESVRRVVAMTDKCVGYINAGGFSAATARPAGQYDERALVSNAAGLSEYDRNFEVQERFFRDS